MFSGIIECMAEIKAIEEKGTNKIFTLQSNISHEMKIDQSVAHNGACLTVIGKDEKSHKVEAILETLDKTNLGDWKVGDRVNLERCMKMNDRLDGHIVQGHVDTKGKVERVENQDGSWNYYFSYQAHPDFITVPKGSICVNGVSLTVVNSGTNTFSVSIIPYTYENTVFSFLKEGDAVNLEFDIIGKYMAKLYQMSKAALYDKTSKL